MKIAPIQVSINVVLPNYNGKHLFAANLPSLYDSLRSATQTFEIIVVDDASRDDSVDYLQQSYPDIIVTRNKVNLGFSRTCNRGIDLARHELTCVVNTDVTFTKDYFVKAIAAFSSPEIFAVKGDIKNYSGSIDNIINTETTVGLYFSRGFLKFDHGLTRPVKHIETFCLLGCCFVARTKLLQQLGGFDPIFSPFYWEDSDIALRAIKHNYKIAYQPDAVVYHKISSTLSTSQTKLKRTLVSTRNKFIFTWLHLRNPSDWLYHMSFLLLNITTRWLTLNWKFYYCLLAAFWRISFYRSRLVPLSFSSRDMD